MFWLWFRYELDQGKELYAEGNGAMNELPVNLKMITLMHYLYGETWSVPDMYLSPPESTKF